MGGWVCVCVGGGGISPSGSAHGIYIIDGNQSRF